MATKKYISLSNLKSFLNNLKNIFATKTDINAKSDKVHTHSISDVANLQSALDGKAATSHGTHVSYSTTAPVMDGSASVGSASTVARSDHKHPTDTSRAAQTSLDSHTSNTTSHITSTERSNWNTAYTHSQTSHAPSNAEANQNAFSNVKVGDVTIAAESKTDTLTLVAGNNITLTPDATNDQITISAKDTTYTLGSFGITATAAELNKLDGVTATATEINYVDGVTSNIQTQLDSKASSGHTHSYAGSSSVGGAATSANKLATARTISLTGDVTGSTTFDGSGNVSITTVINDDSHNHTIANIDNLQTSLDAKQVTITGGASTITSSNLTASRALVSDGSGKVAVSAVTSTELGYLDGVTSNVQIQLDGKAASSHNHSATNITSGTLSSDRLPTVPISKGGTGATTATAALTNLGITATATELNVLDGITATTTELNYVDGVTSNVQTQLNNKASSTHNHGLLHTDFTKQIDDTTVDSGWSMINNSYSGFLLKSLRTQKDAPAWTIGNYSSGIAFGGADTKGVITHAYNSPQIRFAGGNADKPVWNFTLSASSGKTYTLPSSDGTIALTSSNITGNAATATNVAWSGVTSKPSYYDAKAIKGITRSGTTFTYTCMDGTTGTFTQQDNNTTYSVATTSANGLMSSSDKSKLDGIDSGANKYTLPAAGSSLGGVKSGGDVTISNGTITVNDDSHNHIVSNIDGLQSALDGKLSLSTGGTVNGNTVLRSNTNVSDGVMADATITSRSVVDGTSGLPTAIASMGVTNSLSTSNYGSATITANYLNEVVLNTSYLNDVSTIKLTPTKATIDTPFVSSYPSWQTIKVSHGTSGKESGFTAERTDTGTCVRFGVGAAGINHGVWSHTQNRWLIHGNANNIFIGENRAYGEKELYNNTTGTAETITLSDSTANYTYLEIYYKDNNSREFNSTKIYSPNGKSTDLFLVEAVASSTLIRRTRYSISGNKLTPDLTTAGYIQIYHNGTANKVGSETNYLHIVRVVGLV